MRHWRKVCARHVENQKPLTNPLPEGEGTKMLPLPLGEGWGEGSRYTANFTSPKRAPEGPKLRSTIPLEPSALTISVVLARVP